MMISLIDALADRIVGTVESVSANSISVLVDSNAPHATALSAGSPVGFPRINGYLLVPNETGATVGTITAVRVERLPFPKQGGKADFGLVDLPFPARLVSLTPLGTLVGKQGLPSGTLAFEVRRGVDVFPSVGDPVVLPTDAQLRAIVEGEDSEGNGRVLLGTCPTAGGAPVHVNPDKLFGRHLAILGNTGAGKSCTVAGLIRWSLAEARSARLETGHAEEPNARFIVLDPNGEYAKAFKGLNARVFQVEPKDGARRLTVPAWLWNGEEWAAFTAAAPGVQRPLLLDAIRSLRSGVAAPDPAVTKLRSRVRNYRNRFRSILQSAGYMGFPQREDCAVALVNMAAAFNDLAERCSDEGMKTALSSVVEAARLGETNARSYVDKKDGSQKHKDFDDFSIQNVMDALDAVAGRAGLLADERAAGENIPRFFPVSELPSFVEALAADMSGRDVSHFVDSLSLRIRSLFTAGPLASVTDLGDAPSVSLEGWLTSHIGADQASNGQIAVLDLSLVPSDVVHIVVAVLARMVFEAVQRHRREAGAELPTVLVLEEAHTFVHHSLTAEGASPAGRACCQTFERIAREGRKFGLGLVLSSQRPSEVSPTVLSQCNTFLLHRIVSDRDQDLVRRLVPDGLGDLLRELPSLPSRRAILLGWGAPAPLLVEIRELPEAERPHSPDPKFWDVWTGKAPCDIDWKKIAGRWAAEAPATEELDPTVALKRTTQPDEEANGEG